MSEEKSALMMVVDGQQREIDRLVAELEEKSKALSLALDALNTIERAAATAATIVSLRAS